MNKDVKKQLISQIFTTCYQSRTHCGLPISFIKLSDELDEPLLSNGLPKQFASQKIWYWKKGISIPLRTPFILLKQFTDESDWRHELAVEVLEVIESQQ